MAAGTRKELKRLEKELTDMKTKTDAPVTADVHEGNIQHWKGVLQGPEDSP
jgi:ubiquitin-protein ligase